jgi:hypothetical protein
MMADVMELELIGGRVPHFFGPFVEANVIFSIPQMSWSKTHHFQFVVNDSSSTDPMALDRLMGREMGDGLQSRLLDSMCRGIMTISGRTTMRDSQLGAIPGGTVGCGELGNRAAGLEGEV